MAVLLLERNGEGLLLGVLVLLLPTGVLTSERSRGVPASEVALRSR
jgi:hypothetical protein